MVGFMICNPSHFGWQRDLQTIIVAVVVVVSCIVEVILESDLQLVFFVGSGRDQILAVESRFNLMTCVVAFARSTNIEPLVSVNLQFGGAIIECFYLLRRQILNLIVFFI